jgi:RecJ-like exonuclease
MSISSNGLFEAAQVIAERIMDKSFNEVQIISHIDADGLTAASIASLTLSREEIKHEIKFVKQLDDSVIKDLEKSNNDSSGAEKLFWFTDLGSGMRKQINHLNPIITDHHAPSILDYDVPVQARTDLLKFGDILDHQKDDFHLNPHLFNLDGTYDVSGAGTVYQVSTAINIKNRDLAYLAIIGAVGDLQDSRYHQLTGTNRKILNDAETSGRIKTNIDISTFGRESRPLQNLLMYSTDPYFPGLTMNETNCIKFYKRLDIPLKENGKQRHWVDLSFDERKNILSELMELLLSKGIGHRDAKRLLGEVYSLPTEQKGTPLHDAKEFATLLNSCGKYNRPETGYNICLGDRKEHLNQGYHLLKGHKSILMEGMQYVKDTGIQDFGIIQYFDVEDKIPDNIVGTITSMMLANNDTNSDRTLFGFIITEDGENLKVSARATRVLVNQGLNLSEVMRESSRKIGEGSVGGGHDIAAGATIPRNKKEEFLKIAEDLIKNQLRNE